MSSSLILCNNNEPFLDQTVMGNKKWILYNNQRQRAQWLDWDEAPEHFSSQTCTKERSWPLSGRLLPIWYTIAFWIPEKSLHLRSMLSKPTRYTENREVCSRHCSTEWTQFSSMMTFKTTKQTNTSKVEQIGLRSFASSDLLPTTSSSIWKNLYLLLSFALNLKLF